MWVSYGKIKIIDIIGSLVNKFSEIYHLL